MLLSRRCIPQRAMSVAASPLWHRSRPTALAVPLLVVLYLLKKRIARLSRRQGSFDILLRTLGLLGADPTAVIYLYSCGNSALNASARIGSA